MMMRHLNFWYLSLGIHEPTEKMKYEATIFPIVKKLKKMGTAGRSQ
jgi:hypothetical protein